MIQNSIGRSKLLLLGDQPRCTPQPTRQKRGRQRKRGRRSVAWEAWRFLRTTPEKAARFMGYFEMDDVPQIHAALQSIFPKLRIRRAVGWSRDHRPNEWGPERLPFDMGDGHTEWLITSGVLFCELPLENQRMVVVLREERLGPNRDNVSVELLGPGGLQDMVRQKFVELRQTVRALPHFLKGQVIDADGRPLPRPDKTVSLDDVALPRPTRELLRHNTVDLLQNRQRYLRWKIPLTRGILLHGPPGNGKTMIGRALASMGLGTFIHVNPEDLVDGGFKRLFRLARRLTPTILFFEDLDFIAGHHYREFGSARLAELLVQLDGLERNDGIIAIATTNKLKMLDPAIQGRPNRFDVVIEIGPPDLQGRRAILEKQVWGLASDSVIAAAAELTEDLSGAQVKETAIHACQLAIQADLEPGQLSIDHFASAVKQLYRIDRRRPVGFSDSPNND